MKAVSVSHELGTSDPKLDSSHKLLRFIWVLVDKDESRGVPLSELFSRIIDLSSKGYLLYGFKPGKWAAGEKEFTSRSDAFASDLGFLAKQGTSKLKPTVKALNYCLPD